MAGLAKYWTILNPAAEKGKAAKKYPAINDFLKKTGRAFEIILTRGPGDAIEIIRNLNPCEHDVVVAAGGDGTCNEVVNGLLTRENNFALPPLLGILPIGRGKTRLLDAGLVTGGFFPEGRYFINGVGIGFDTKVGFDAVKMKHVHSGLAYALGALINIARYVPSPVIRIRYGDNETTLPAVIVSLMNGRRMGGIFYMGPNALLDDGLLDICSIRRPASRLRLTAVEGGMTAHCDGKILCYDGKELEIKCLPGALRLIGA